jgi:RNA polymerase sigma-70 factor (ECF subfamily)
MDSHAKANEAPTGSTLLLYRRNPTDKKAWGAFVERYGNIIYAWCRKWGLQRADAENLTQDLLAAMAKKIAKYEPGCRFRPWMKTVTHNAIKNFHRSRRIRTENHLNEIEAKDDLDERLESEYRRELLEDAKSLVRLRVEPKTWDVFNQRAEGRPAADVAKALDMTIAGVNQANYRVMGLLRREVARLEGAHGLSEDGHE